MKKSLLALAVISAATMASAEVKLSGDITVALTSKNGSSPVFSEAGSELNIDASQDIGGGNTAYAHVELELDRKPGWAHNGGSIKVDEGRVGIKGSWGDVRLGDTGTGCGYTNVGGVTSDQQLSFYDTAGCGKSYGGAEGIRYSNKFGPVSAGLSYHPNVKGARDQVSLGLGAEFGPVKGSLGYTDHSKDHGSNTFLLGLEGGFGDMTVGAQYEKTNDFKNVQDQKRNAWELGANYSLQTGDIYAAYGQSEIKDAAGTKTTDYAGWVLGYKHNISDRTWTWIEIGDNEEKVAGSKTKTSWSTGLAHKF